MPLFFAPWRFELDSEALARQLANLAAERKALDLTIVDVRKHTSYTDYLVIASGTSDRHVQSIAEFVEQTMRQEGELPLGSEGAREGQWALVDFGNAVLHVFHQFNRDVYQLEALFADAPKLTIDSEPARQQG